MTNNRELYLTMFIHQFAAAKGLTIPAAFAYLHNFKALQFLEDCYEAEHLLDDATVLDDLTAIARKNGGAIE